MTANVRQAAGSLLVVGLGGAGLTELERAWLKLVRPAGIILFRRNIVDAAQTRALLSEASEFCSPQSFRCVDVEGGSVDRLRDALAPMPSAQAVARADARERDDRGSRTPTLSQKTRKDEAPALISVPCSLVPEVVHQYSTSTTEFGLNFCRYAFVSARSNFGSNASRQRKNLSVVAPSRKLGALNSGW